jgi:hypothetical protein
MKNKQLELVQTCYSGDPVAVIQQFGHSVILDRNSIEIGRISKVWLSGFHQYLAYSWTLVPAQLHMTGGNPSFPAWWSEWAQAARCWRRRARAEAWDLVSRMCCIARRCIASPSSLSRHQTRCAWGRVALRNRGSREGIKVVSLPIWQRSIGALEHEGHPLWDVVCGVTTTVIHHEMACG